MTDWAALDAIHATHEAPEKSCTLCDMESEPDTDA
jgi:hypothetical protein